MTSRRQPWILNWFADSMGLFFMPFLFLILGLFNLPPFRTTDKGLLKLLILFVLIIDWAHIFAQYPRIFFNPLEKVRMKWIYPFSYFLLIPVFTLVLNFLSIKMVDTILVYFVIFHFIKQHYGFIKIFSKSDGPKTQWEGVLEETFIYLTMWTPVLHWHANSIGYDYKWTNLFFKIPGIESISLFVWGLYSFVMLNYLFMEFRRTRRNKFFNVPKNLSILSAVLGWGCITFLSHSTSLIIFTVTLTHDLSYTYFVWAIGRRDERLLKNRIKIFSWNSAMGFFFYVVVLILVSHMIMIIHLELTRDHNWNYLIYGDIFNSIKTDNQWLINLGWSLFFATQAHHYFIDRFLWKKEKDLEYMIKTGKFSLS